ncbi:hypothetical protein [Priestia taiwanensis]|uniref:Uncharacterized protein n=1 Tax=Priestia taiwanensis TaxID=1347902 RepID=A0A917AKL1_9BACI|nr:hypothetical protein [Priestia taiwanensis]MBM7361980.1 hypothetical protein [Priestia taiwanensis]GGE58502.1 hypothetical protein GCM10007140_06060 [Priestia taiwanensis]
MKKYNNTNIKDYSTESLIQELEKKGEVSVLYVNKAYKRVELPCDFKNLVILKRC